MNDFSRRNFLKYMSSLAALSILNPNKLFAEEKEIPIRGVYFPGWSGVNNFRINNLINQMKEGNLNTLMIDVKNAYGELFYEPKTILAKNIGAQVRTEEGHKRIIDIDYLVNQTRENNIRLIGRHVMFADSKLFENTNFKLLDDKNKKWVDMKNQKVIDYNLSLLSEESNLGFDELVLDYIRFPDKKGFGDELMRCEVIDDVVYQAKNVLSSKNIGLALQVFGYSAWDHYASSVGQRIETLEKNSDVIYPMVYPSHFVKGSLGFKNPNDHPYEFISQGYIEAMKKIETNCKIIPMIQGFGYTSNQIKKQIIAVKNNNMPGYVSWNPRGDHKELIKAINT